MINVRKGEKMNLHVPIHTTLPIAVRKHILEMGNGSIQKGIITAVQISMQKQYNVESELRRIANTILNEVGVEE